MLPFDSGISPASDFISLTPDNHLEAFPGLGEYEGIGRILYLSVPEPKVPPFKSLLVESNSSKGSRDAVTPGTNDAIQSRVNGRQ